MTRVAQTARGVAVAVLSRVTDDGAYASLALDAELSRAQLSPRDAALCTQILYGTLRALPALDASLQAHLRSPLSRTERFTRASLRAGAYQLLHLDRVPAHAVVDEHVTLVRVHRAGNLAGLVNAVLRKVAQERGAKAASASVSLPAWLSDELSAGLGPDRATRLTAEQALPPPLGLRIEPERSSRQALQQALRHAHPGAEVELSSMCELALLVRRAGAPRALHGYAQGLFCVQEEGAQLVALAAGARPGERIADACAGHGGKTTLLARVAGARGHVSALDLDERKLARIAPELARLGLPAERVDTRAVDLAVGTGGLARDYDRVLVDAPCTGLGTLVRRPEILLRVGPADPARMADLQLRLLSRAATLVRAGGELVVAVCSPTRAEGAGLAARFEQAHPRAERLPSALPGLDNDPDGVLRIGPWNAPEGSPSSPDAYQVVRFRLP